MFFLSCVCYAIVRVCLYICLVVTCWERADLLALICGVITVSLSLSHWCPRSGVVLDCIDC